ncbi:hypothetical protein OG552_13030 [Streptomyces sp. NBC_01476]|uniref:hypothetical protein n=1 Tax=Streptomyces sp. NBC_01476 TaxID=2903881 RepID=UPI002E2F8F95|nr:hypothetical protein [Streptomyces sp. NBC_01476]
MQVTMLTKVCDKKDCPTLYATDRGTLLVQGYTGDEHGLTVPQGEGVVEIPVELLKKAIADGVI